MNIGGRLVDKRWSFGSLMLKPNKNCVRSHNLGQAFWSRATLKGSRERLSKRCRYVEGQIYEIRSNGLVLWVFEQLRVDLLIYMLDRTA